MARRSAGALSAKDLREQFGIQPKCSTTVAAATLGCAPAAGNLQGGQLGGEGSAWFVLISSLIDFDRRKKDGGWVSKAQDAARRRVTQSLAAKRSMSELQKALT